VSAQDESMPGSDAANQHRTEPMPPTEGHADPEAAPGPASVERPSLESMNVGAADPQAPSHPAAGAESMPSPSDVPSEQTPILTGNDPAEVLPSAHAGTTTGRTSGPVEPVQDTAGDGHRQPGSLGSTGPDEQIETDVERSAANAGVAGTSGTPSGAGDAHGVPVVSEEPSPGTSQESATAQGTRTPL
jgi:hypothetical protein